MFSVQRWVRGYGDEPLMAVLPGVALDELWEVLGGRDMRCRRSALVAVVSLAGLVAVILAGSGRAGAKLAILRSVGAARARCWRCWRWRGAGHAVRRAAGRAGLGRAIALLVTSSRALGAGAARALAGARRDAPDGRAAAGRLAGQSGAGLAGLPAVAGRRAVAARPWGWQARPRRHSVNPTGELL